MNNLLVNTLQQEIEALQAQLAAIEERAAALRATLAHYKEALAAEQQTATEALSVAKNAQETALSALVAAKAAQEQLANIPTVETSDSVSPEVDDEVEIELIYEEEDETEETPIEETIAEEEEVEIELVYNEEDETEEEAIEIPAAEETIEDESIEEEIVEEVVNEPIAVVEVEKSATKTNLLPPIEDIRKAISLGDRFLFQRELFAGNGELMNKTIDKLNSLSSLEEAQKYISKYFSWDTESQAYELFMNILKRRW